MSLDLTSFDAALKQHYTKEMVENLVFKDNPLLALVSKDENFGGRNLPVPMIHGNPQNRSATFATAQAGTSTSLVKAFLLTRVKDYGIATVDNETLEASKENENAFLEAAVTEIDGVINGLSRSLAIALYRSGWGDIGQIATNGISSATVTLGSAADANNFEVNQVVVFSSSQNAATLRNSGGSLTVQSVDRSAGTVTFTAAVSTLNAVQAGDYIFVKGDRQDSATPSRLKIAGLEAWCPATAPSASESFFGVDRSVDPARLAGSRYDASAGVPIEEALIEGAARVSEQGGKIDHMFMGFRTWSSLEKALGSKVQYTDLSVKNTEIGFRGIVVNGPRGPINVIPDQNCPSNRVFGCELSALKLYSLGKAPRVIDTDGLSMLRQASADGVEVRYGYYGNMACKKPVSLLNIKLA